MTATVSRLEDEARRELYAKQSRVERFESAMVPFDDDELERAKVPHPHAFMDGARGLFPVGEVTVLAAPGREGKTFAAVGMAASYVTGIAVGGLHPQADKRVLIYSAEDDRPQFARKLLAITSRLGQADTAMIRERILVPDLMAEGMQPFATLVGVYERQPMAMPAVKDVVDALQDQNIGLLIFETASTLSDGDEDNRTFRILIRSLRDLARKVGCAVVLTHHTSQAAAQALPDLSISPADIRGATALVYNARQTAMLVNLGSDDDGFPDGDARTVLRRMVFPNRYERVAAWVTLDTSKAANPPTVFFRWEFTEYGPAVFVAATPERYRSMSWRKLREAIGAERAKVKQSRKDEATDAKIEVAVDAVRKLEAEGKQPTGKAVSEASGHTKQWASPYLLRAVEKGLLTCTHEPMPRMKDLVAVYHTTRQEGCPE